MLNKETMAIMPVTTRNFMYFFKKIRVMLRKEKWSRHSTEEEFSIDFHTKNFGYDYTAIQMVTKIYKLLGWKLKMTYFCTRANHEGYDYCFEATKIK